MMSTKSSALCLVCYDLVDKNIFVPAKESGKIFKNCLKYLHTAVATNIPNDEEEIKLKNSTHLPFCKKCFDSSLELTQLTEELKKCQKEISDLSTSFTLSVLHRRTNSAYFSGHGKTKSISDCETSQQTIKLNVTGLPPQLFSIHPMESISPQGGINQPYYNIGTHFLLENNEEVNDDLFINFECGEEQSSNIDQFIDEELNDPLGGITVQQPVKSKAVQKNKIFNQKKKQENIENGRMSLLPPIKMPKIELERLDDFEKKVIIPQKVSLQHWVERKGTVRKAGVGNSIRRRIDVDKPFHSGNRSYQPKTNVSSLRWKNKSMLKSQAETLNRCEFCSKVFQSIVLLNRHKRRVHSSTGQLHCPICEKSFNQASGLRAHEVVHTTERPFKCLICEKTFRFDSNRIRHQGLHTKPNGRYPCTFCDKAFGLSSDWSDHVQNVHNVSNPKENSKNSYSVAMKHSKITIKKTARKCSFCEKSFTKRSALKIHEQSHTAPTKVKKEKASKYKCSYCGKTFDKRNARNEHENVHKQERRYKCLYCRKTFLYSSNRSRHQRLAHNHNVT